MVNSSFRLVSSSTHYLTTCTLETGAKKERSAIVLVGDVGLIIHVNLENNEKKQEQNVKAILLLNHYMPP